MHKTTIARALGYLARYKVEFVLSLAMALVYVVASLYIPLVAGEAIDSLVAGGVDFDMLLSCLMRIFVTALVCFISQYALSRLNNRMAYRISHDMRNDAFDKISRLPFSYLDSHRQGDVVARVISDVDQVSDGLLLGFSQFFSAVLTILMTLYYLFSLDYLIALVVILVSPLSLVVATFIAKKTHRYFRQTAEKRSLQTDITDEFITDSSEVLCYNLQASCQKTFDEVNEQWAASHPRREQYRVRRSRAVRRTSRRGGETERRRSGQRAELCEPVHQALQRDHGSGHRAAERSGVRLPHLQPPGREGGRG